MKLNFLTRWLDLNLFEEIGSSIPPMRAWIVHNIIKISLEGSLLCINFQNHLLGKVYTTISITIEMEEIRELAASDRKAGTGSLYQTTLPRWHHPLPLSRPRSHDYYSRTTPEISYSTYPPIQETLETPHFFSSLSTIPHQVNNASIILGRDRRKNEGRNSETSNALDNSNTRGGSTKSLGTKRNTQGVARVPGAIVLIHFGRAFITQRPAYRASFETLSVSRLANE